jgi:hypothetical protein
LSRPPRVSVMGLDCYLCEADASEINKQYSFETFDLKLYRLIGSEIQYWRKHFALNDWMMNLLYSKSGGAIPEYDSVVVDARDLDRLELHIRATPRENWSRWSDEDNRPRTDNEDDLRVITKARECIARGKVVYYVAS